ncbi:MAG: hypothetical protein SNG02_05360 [Rikenellaceae bacterium]
MVRSLLLLSIFMVACSPRLQTTSCVKDSVLVEVRPRIVTIRDTVLVEIPMISERVTVREDTSILVNQYAHSEAIIRPDGELYHTLETTPQRIPTEYKTIVEVRDSIIYRNRTEIRSVEVERELSWWQRLQLRGFWVLATFIGGVVIVRRLLI